MRTVGCDFSVFGGIKHRDPVGVHDHNGIGVMVLYCQDARVETVQLDAELRDA